MKEKYNRMSETASQTLNDVKLSIIIPCFNSYNLMSKALSMFSENAEEEFEVIIVDDCSTDGSYESLCTYADEANYHVKILKNEVNSGPGASRNKGIDAAAGEYITFLDADDCFKDNYFPVIMPELDGKIDCLVYDFFFLYKNGKRSRCSSFFKEMQEGFLDNRETIAYIRGLTWGKIYRKSMVDKTGIRFLTQKRDEDWPFTKSLISYCDSIKYIKLPLYEYTINKGSLTHDIMMHNPEDTKRALEYVSASMNTGMDKEIELIFAIEYLIPVSHISARRLPKGAWKKFVLEEEKKCESYMKNEYIIHYSKTKKIELALIHAKDYNTLKLYAWLKNIVR